MWQREWIRLIEGQKRREIETETAGRGLINEKGVTWRYAAHQPRFAPFHLRFHPLLRSSFGFSFCSLSFSLFASSYLCYTYFVNETPLLFRFFSSLRAPFRLETDWYFYFNLRCSLEFSHYYTFTQLRFATLLRSILVLPLISRLQTIPSNFSSISSRSFMFVGLLGKRIGKQRVIIKTIAAKFSPLCIFDRAANSVRILRTVSSVRYPRLSFNPQSDPQLPR